MPDDILFRLTYEVRAAQHHERLSANGPKRCTLVAEVGGEIVGFVCGRPRREGRQDYDDELHAIYLFKKYQGFGIVRQLLLSFANWLSTGGYKSMMLWALHQPHSTFS